MSAEIAANSLRIYSRPGCHLCELMIEELLPLVRGKLKIEVVDIDSRSDWCDEYGTRIPVLEHDAKFVCQYTLDVPAIQRILARNVGS